MDTDTGEIVWRVLGVGAGIGAVLSPIIVALTAWRVRKHDRALADLNSQHALSLKEHETRLKIVADVRLRLIDRDLASFAEARRSLRAVLGALHELGVCAHVDGVSEVTNAALLRFYEAARAAPGGTFTPVDLEDDIEQFLTKAQDLADAILGIAAHGARKERWDALCELEGPNVELSNLSRDIFRRWSEQITKAHETVITKVESKV
jgi:hypothetical protein